MGVWSAVATLTMKTLLIEFTVMFLSANISLVAADSAALKPRSTVWLSDVSGRFDHFAVDTNGHRLFVAALGNNTLEIIDTVQGTRLKSLTGLRKPTGVLYLAEENQIAVASGDDGTLKVFDGATYKLVQSLGSLDDADNLRFDAKAKRIFLGYGDGALAIIDAKAMKQTDSIKLAAHPESFQIETSGSRIFVNIPDAKQVAVIDRERRAVITTWSMQSFHANFPMGLDESNHRLFVGCRNPARLVVLDTNTGHSVADLEVSGDTDDLFFDAARKRIYLSCGDGFIDIITQRDANTYGLREKIATRPGARTGFFSSALNQFFLAVPKRGNQTAEIRVYSAGD
jgi:DNA-binding beta-propeller fold protein YncE